MSPILRELWMSPNLPPKSGELWMSPNLPFVRRNIRQIVIILYAWTTPNGRKVCIMPDETGLPYGVVPIDISNGEQCKAELKWDWQS